MQKDFRLNNLSEQPIKSTVKKNLNLFEQDSFHHIHSVRNVRIIDIK
jgi:hypothetical protein